MAKTLLNDIFDKQEVSGLNTSEEEIKVLWIKISTQVSDAFELCWDCSDSSAWSCSNQ